MKIRSTDPIRVNTATVKKSEVRGGSFQELLHTRLDDIQPQPDRERVADRQCGGNLGVVFAQRLIGPILALCPGAEFGPSKRWPEAHYATLANAYLAKGWDVWLFGGPNDKMIANSINAATQNQCVAPVKISNGIEYLFLSLSPNTVLNQPRSVPVKHDILYSMDHEQDQQR